MNGPEVLKCCLFRVSRLLASILSKSAPQRELGLLLVSKAAVFRDLHVLLLAQASSCASSGAGTLLSDE